MSKLPLLFLVPVMTAAAPPGINEDESKVPPYTLPDPLTCTDGTKVVDARTWREKRRPELLRLFESEVYGRTPLGRPPEMKCLAASEKKDARGGKATRREIDILFFGREDGPRMRLLLYLPNKATGRSPVFLGLNFGGNYTTSAESDLPLASGWVPNNKEQGITENKAQESARGSQAGRWQIDYALDHGYGVATAYYGDIDPDFHDSFKNGVHAVTGVPKPGEWGSIGAWAWGLSRALDCLEKEPGVDSKKVIVMGHSRLGKTALWAGAQDERFALVISNDSGCGGAALSSRWFGETVARINTSFPHWFTSGYKAYNDREESCPVDQHELIALIAPRPVLVNSATQDTWADPRGEFLGAAGAASVYKLLGTDGISQTECPAPDTLLTSRIGYYLRPGPHDVTLKDWQAYVTFADKHLGP
jgi:(4-O-methyl)-D-glucuronate---lignin esterase